MSVVLVKKRDERVETFHRQKIFHGLERAEKSRYGELSSNRTEILDEVTKKILLEIESLTIKIIKTEEIEVIVLNCLNQEGETVLANQFLATRIQWDKKRQ